MMNGGRKCPPNCVFRYTEALHPSTKWWKDKHDAELQNTCNIYIYRGCLHPPTPATCTLNCTATTTIFTPTRIPTKHLLEWTLHVNQKEFRILNGREIPRRCWPYRRTKTALMSQASRRWRIIKWWPIKAICTDECRLYCCLIHGVDKVCQYWRHPQYVRMWAKYASPSIYAVKYEQHQPRGVKDQRSGWYASHENMTPLSDPITSNPVVKLSKSLMTWSCVDQNN
jgi:hypothetical protein